MIGDFDHYLYSDINRLQQQMVQQEQHLTPDDDELEVNIDENYELNKSMSHLSLTNSQQHSDNSLKYF